MYSPDVGGSWKLSEIALGNHNHRFIWILDPPLGSMFNAPFYSSNVLYDIWAMSIFP